MKETLCDPDEIFTGEIYMIRRAIGHQEQWWKWEKEESGDDPGGGALVFIISYTLLNNEDA